MAKEKALFCLAAQNRTCSTSKMCHERQKRERPLEGHDGGHLLSVLVHLPPVRINAHGGDHETAAGLVHGHVGKVSIMFEVLQGKLVCRAASSRFKWR